ncbi:MAG: hypothetical protein K0U39_04615 [Alphaproteobacteria bacterium]|nr:hypothetical protein [Alphaproteobacteria bacterium]
MAVPQPHHIASFHLNAYAKLNLTLHVTGKRADNYHLLHSDVIFITLSDSLTLTFNPKKNGDEIIIDGAFSKLLTDTPLTHNLVMIILASIRQLIDFPPLTISLTKNIPIGAGLGGGTADAAALLRFFVEQGKLSHQQAIALAKNIGGDGLCCYHACAGLMQGIGDIFTPHEAQHIPAKMQHADIVILWCGQFDGHGLSTADIYRQCEIGAPFNVSDDYWQNLQQGRNDLQATAINAMPEISAMLDFLTDFNGDLVRMTGSGSAVFAIFLDGITSERLTKMQNSLPPEWFFWHGTVA